MNYCMKIPTRLYPEVAGKGVAALGKKIKAVVLQAPVPEGVR